MEKIDLTGETQYRFKKNCRTETACLEIQSKIGALCDERKHVTMASLDLSAAFDVVNTKQTTTKDESLWNTGSNHTHDSRLAYCEVGGKSSMLRVIEEGTVQESILGPILFAIFVSTLWDIIETSSFA